MKELSDKFQGMTNISFCGNLTLQTQNDIYIVYLCFI